MIIIESKSSNNSFVEAYSNFDFDKVLQYMQKTNWRWALGDGELRVPKHVFELMDSVQLLKYEVEKTLHKSNEKKYWLSSGGFTVEYNNGKWTISFTDKLNKIFA